MASDGPLAAKLKVVLSDVFTLYLQAHVSHWNVVGPDFSEYHDLFGMISDDIYESVDPLAENIRKIGALTPTGMTEFVSLREIEDGPMATDARSLAEALMENNDEVIECLNEAFVVASDQDQQGIANFLSERIDAHQKWAWQLRSHLGVVGDMQDDDDSDMKKIARMILGEGDKKPPLGTGQRFDMLVKSMKKRGMAEDRAKAIAAAIGRKKYGKKKFQKMAAKGKKMSESAYGDMYIPKHR